MNWSRSKRFPARSAHVRLETDTALILAIVAAFVLIEAVSLGTRTRSPSKSMTVDSQPRLARQLPSSLPATPLVPKLPQMPEVEVPVVPDKPLSVSQAIPEHQVLPTGSSALTLFPDTEPERLSQSAAVEVTTPNQALCDTLNTAAEPLRETPADSAQMEVSPLILTVDMPPAVPARPTDFGIAITIGSQLVARSYFPPPPAFEPLKAPRVPTANLEFGPSASPPRARVVKILPLTEEPRVADRQPRPDPTKFSPQSPFGDLERAR